LLKSEDVFLTTCALTLVSLQNGIGFGHLEPDLSSIEGPVDDVSEFDLNAFRTFVSNNDLTKQLLDVPMDQNEETYLTGSQGIYGQAFYSASVERLTLSSHPLRDTLERMNKLLNREFLNKLIGNNNFLTKVKPEHGGLRRLEIIPEKALKHRMIVIADFWSQNTLLPVHNHVMKLLRSIKHHDATYCAHECISEISTLNFNYRECVDLKNFTDYLPLSLQKIVVSVLFGQELADLWTKVMTEPILKRDGGIIRYTRGQPMGLLSSWAVATLTHHYLIRLAADSVRSKLHYCILGDDVIMWDEKLSQAYRSIINQFKIPESLAKLIRSRDRGFEFCKRIFRGTQEVTPLSYTAFSLGPVERYLEFYRLLKSNLSYSDRHGALLVALYPKNLTVLEEQSLQTYLSIMTSDALPKKDVTHEKPYLNLEDNTLLYGRILKYSLRVMDLVDNCQDLVDFKPTQSNVRLKGVGVVGFKRVRGVVDEPVEAIYHQTILTYLVQLEDTLKDWSKFFKKSASDGSMYAPGGHIKWNLVDMPDRKVIQFYKLDPKTRFSDRRSPIIKQTMKNIERFLSLTSLDAEKYPNGLYSKEEDLKAFIWRKLIHTSDLTEVLKYKGHTVELHDLIGLKAREVQRLVPGWSYTKGSPKGKPVELEEVDPDTFGG
jgi:hypothetical protein